MTLVQWHHTVVGKGALAPPIFGTYFSKTLNQPPISWQNVC